MKKMISYVLAASLVLGNTHPVWANSGSGEGSESDRVGISLTKEAGVPYTDEERILEWYQQTVGRDETLPAGWSWETPDQVLTGTFADTIAVCKENGVEKNRVKVRMKRIVDTVMPTGKITVASHQWNEFLNQVTFGLFFKETKTVAITADDDLSGVDSIGYYVADKGISEEEVKSIRTWNTYNGTFDLHMDEKSVIYAKLTDKEGNTAYLSSDGLVIDGTQPVIYGVENGRDYHEAVTWSATDPCLDQVKITSVIEEERVSKTQTAQAEEVSGIITEPGTYTIEAIDRAGNASSVSFTISRLPAEITPTPQTVIFEPGLIYDVTQLFTFENEVGTATYQVTQGTDLATVEGTELIITGAGTFTITVTTARNGYIAEGSATATLTVEREKMTDVVIEKGDVETDLQGVVVSGLEEYTDSQDGSLVDVVLHVIPEAENAAEQELGKELSVKLRQKVEEVIGELAPTLPKEAIRKEFLNISLTKSVDGGEATPIDHIDRVVEIRLDYDMTGKYYASIFRELDGEIMSLQKLDGRAEAGTYQDGTFAILGNEIYIYAKNFSLYSLAYATEEAPEKAAEYKVNFDDGMGNVTSQTKTVGEKLTKPADPVRDGYTFAGWYSGEQAWDFAKDVVSADMTLVAKWEKAATVTKENTVIVKAAKTGDTAPVAFLFVLMTGTAVMFGTAAVRRKRETDR